MRGGVEKGSRERRELGSHDAAPVPKPWSDFRPQARRSHSPMIRLDAQVLPFTEWGDGNGKLYFNSWCPVSLKFLDLFLCRSKTKITEDTLSLRKGFLCFLGLVPVCLYFDDSFLLSKGFSECVQGSGFGDHRCFPTLQPPPPTIASYFTSCPDIADPSVHGRWTHKTSRSMSLSENLGTSMRKRPWKSLMGRAACWRNRTRLCLVNSPSFLWV